MLKQKFPKWMLWILLLMLLIVFSVALINLYVYRVGSSFLTEQPQPADAAIVLGASVRGDRVSAVLAQRLDAALIAYEKGIVPCIIVSGDHGTKDYNEVKAMQKYLWEHGVPKEDIFMDHAGFSTYDTVYRARDVFRTKRVLLVSQKEHLIRALYIAKKLNLPAEGLSSGNYSPTLKAGQSVREIFARVKAFLQCEIFCPEPKFLGEPIPVFHSSGTETEG